jgi:endonuclease/exonuclease/phosphatase family metal-dependent hydrolase
MTDLVVASFNIRNGRALDGWNSWPFRRRSTIAMARHLDADLLGIQEAYGCQARYLDRRLPGYERHGRGRNAKRGGEWCAVYSRSARIEVRSSTTQWYGDTPEVAGSRLSGSRFPRVATSVDAVDRSTGSPLRFVNTHLDERSAANRLRSIELLLAWVDLSVPTIVLGDLNATPERQPELFAALADAGLVAALPDDGRGTAHDYRGGTDHRRLDHIFVSRHWTVVDAGVVTGDGRYPSDHWPVRASLALV